MPNSEGEKLHEPIIWRQRLPEGTDPAQLGSCCGIPASPHCRCRHRSGAHLGVQQGSGAPHWEHWAIPSCRATRCLPACMCAFVRNVRGARVPCAQSPALPPCEPLPSHPLKKKAFCATWDEEQGSGGREDDPAGRMVHLGAAVGERLLRLLLAAAAAAFRLR